MNIKVSELYIYPVKSCRGIPLQRAEVEAFGLAHDRRWMLIDNEGVMLTQRKHARMCLIQPEITETGLRLHAEGMPALEVNYPDRANTVKARVWHDDVQALDAGEAAAKWFSDFLDTACRLVYFPQDEVRQVDLDYARPGERTAFSDGFPLLLISQASLDNLNQRLDSAVTIQRFRPNLVVSGCEAHAEDSWKQLRIGGIDFRVVKPCSRCVIPSINIETAQREEQPLKALTEYRRRDGKIYFGQNVIAESTGVIETGMPVEVIS